VNWIGGINMLRRIKGIRKILVNLLRMCSKFPTLYQALMLPTPTKAKE